MLSTFFPNIPLQREESEDVHIISLIAVKVVQVQTRISTTVCSVCSAASTIILDSKVTTYYWHCIVLRCIALGSVGYYCLCIKSIIVMKALTRNVFVTLFIHWSGYR